MIVCPQVVASSEFNSGVFAQDSEVLSNGNSTVAVDKIVNAGTDPGPNSIYFYPTFG